MSWKVLRGDCVEVLRSMSAESIDACVTDPPYGLSSEPDIAEVLKHWLSGDDYQHRGGGFMGRTWDSFVPGPSYWREVFRVLKPGAHCLAFGGTRTVDMLSTALRLAGFEVRDCIAWMYGSGFPKSLDVSKAIDKAAGVERQDVYEDKPGVTTNTAFGAGLSVGVVERHPVTPEARTWQGWGTALKPAHEPIVVARKPLAGTVSQNVLEHGTGALNIDGCRIGPGDASLARTNKVGDNGWKNSSGGPNAAALRAMNGEEPAGRWPANVVLSHHDSCVPVGTRRVKSHSPAVPQPKFDSDKPGVSLDFKAGEGRNGEFSAGYADADGLEEVAAWDCHPECPVRLLDEQSGETTGLRPDMTRHNAEDTGEHGIYGRFTAVETSRYGDSGGASQFFYTAKASSAERNAGLDGFADGDKRGQSAWGRTCNVCGCSFVDPTTGKPKCAHDDFSWTQTGAAKNVHPTVKPIDLMRWLVRLVVPPGGTCLDPFCGSGTTGIAAVLERFNFIGIEREDEYADIAEARIRWWEQHPEGVELVKALEADRERKRLEDAGQMGLFG